MKMFGFLAPTTTGSRKLFAVSLITAFLLASLSAFSVFAAPSQKAAAEQTWGDKLRELNADRAFFDSFKSQRSNFVNPSRPLKLQRYLNDYAFALKQAEVIVKGRGMSIITSPSTNTPMNGSNRVDQSDLQKLSVWLHRMRALSIKLKRIS